MKITVQGRLDAAREQALSLLEETVAGEELGFSPTLRSLFHRDWVEVSALIERVTVLEPARGFQLANALLFLKLEQEFPSLANLAADLVPGFVWGAGEGGLDLPEAALLWESGGLKQQGYLLVGAFSGPLLAGARSSNTGEVILLLLSRGLIPDPLKHGALPGGSLELTGAECSELLRLSAREAVLVREFQRMLISSVTLGLASSILELSVGPLADRFVNGETSATPEGIPRGVFHSRVAWLAAELDAARLLLWRAGEELQGGQLRRWTSLAAAQSLTAGRHILESGLRFLGIPSAQKAGLLPDRVLDLEFLATLLGGDELLTALSGEGLLERLTNTGRL